MLSFSLWILMGSEKKMNQREINRNSYEETAGQWAEYRRNTVTGKCIIEFESMLKRHSAVLDVGCGTGYPIAAYFSFRGHKVTGLDISDSMIAEAKALDLPDADFIVSDMMDYQPDHEFDAVIAFDSLWYVEEERQEELFHRLAGCLKEGGYLLFTHGLRKGTVNGEMFSSQFIYSSPGREALKEILHKANLTVLQWHENYAEESIGDRELLAICSKNGI
ncbi:MAG: class I SAM-dependent methyltransferase [Erysipelotrichaceae bacterium]|nr:class I SAM-dependent methyltransferase [Erysipelotrichaceae bacterium]